jgi:hypothetical protein
MTSQSPRIYVYKITFEEVPYYYYGVKKEKYFNQEYWGSPITNKWCWELYTPKKQILQLFDYSDSGWEEAVDIEYRLIKPVLNDKWCLNERCGAVHSLNSCRKGAKILGEMNRKNGTGFFKLTKEERIQISKKNGLKNKENNIGICGFTFEQRSEYNKKSGKIAGKIVGAQNRELKRGVCGRSKEKMIADGKKGGTASVKKQRELGIGIFGLSFEQRSQNGKKGNATNKKNRTAIYSLTFEDRSRIAKDANSQKWQCTETGHISNAGGLARYQRARGIDPKKRIRLS